MTEHTKDIQQKKEAAAPVEERTHARRIYTPDVDIIERKDDIVVIADMPGVDENSVDIILEKNLLTIYGKVEAEIPEHHRLSLSEYGIGDYQRAFNISNEVDRERIQATVKNGVLRLVLPKAEALKTRKIAVKAES